MAIDYASVALKVLGAIETAGRPVRFRRASATPPDANKPWAPAAVDGAGAVEVAGKAVMGDRVKRTDVGGREVLTEEWYLAARGLTEPPTTAHTWLKPGEANTAGRSIVDVETVDPAGTPLLYVVFVEA